jgi:amino acid permease
MLLAKHHITRAPLNPLPLFPTNWLSAFSTFPNILYSLSLSTNFFSIYKGLENATDSKMNGVITAEISFCTLLYFLIGVVGRLLIRSNVSVSVLNSIKFNEISLPVYVMIYSGFVIQLFFTYPICFFTCKNNLICAIEIVKSKLN